MKKKISIISQNRAYDGYLKIDEAVINEADGSDNIQYSRFRLVRPDAVAVILYNEDEDKVYLVRQHRYPIHDRIDGDVLELAAGKIDKGEDPKAAAIREVEEEIGFKIQDGKIGLLNEFFASPGYSSEKIYLFYATVKISDRVNAGGGVAGEHENISVESFGVSEFFDMVANGDIVDSKTLIGAQALWHLRNQDVVAAGRKFVEERNLAHAKKIADQVINEGDNAEEDTK